MSQRLSSACHCGPSGQSKHEHGECPHLYHVCGDACGPYYRKHAGGYAARRVVKPLSPEVKARLEAGDGTFPGDFVRSPSGHTNHCEARMEWGDGECECGTGKPSEPAASPMPVKPPWET